MSRRSMRKLRLMSLYGTVPPPNRCDVVVYDEVFDFSLLERGTLRDPSAPAEPPVTLEGVRSVGEKLDALAAEASPRHASAWRESIAKWLPKKVELFVGGRKVDVQSPADIKLEMGDWDAFTPRPRNYVANAFSMQIETQMKADDYQRLEKFLAGTAERERYLRLPRRAPRVPQPHHALIAEGLGRPFMVADIREAVAFLEANEMPATKCAGCGAAWFVFATGKEREDAVCHACGTRLFVKQVEDAVVDEDGFRDAIIVDPSTNLMECPHCGCEAVEPDEEGSYKDNDGVEVGCMHCGYPGHVSFDGDSEPWWFTSDLPGQTCTRDECAECQLEDERAFAAKKRTP